MSRIEPKTSTVLKYLIRHEWADDLAEAKDFAKKLDGKQAYIKGHDLMISFKTVAVTPDPATWLERQFKK